MAAKKKKGKKGQRKKSDGLKDLSMEQMVENGRELMASGRARDAISMLKAAAKKGGEVKGLLFQAYLARESQLRAKGMDKDAGAVRLQALAHMPEPGSLSEEDLVSYMRNSTFDDAVKSYAGYLKRNERSIRAETCIAGLALIHSPGGLPNGLEDDFPLTADAEAVFQAVRLMDDGLWEDALKPLSSISRSSPYAPVRMFCNAMTAFYREDDRAIQRALSMIPDEFPLMPVVERLKPPLPDLPCLWDGPLNTEEICTLLIAHMEKGEFEKAKQTVTRFAEAVTPRNPGQALFHILELIWPLTRNNYSMSGTFAQLANQLLSGEQAKLLHAKIGVIRFSDPCSDAALYLEHLSGEFPDPVHKDIAHSAVLSRTLGQVRERGIETGHGVPGKRQMKLLGISDLSEPELSLGMALHAVTLDGENREAYELIAALPRFTREAKNMVEKGLLRMREVYPKDPFPCLELSSLYYEKNAYRKAEAVLSEAMKLAPHDRQVLDRHVISLLVSADRRIRRGKLGLAAEDLAGAAQLSSGKTLPLVVEKQIVFDMESKGQLSLFDKEVIMEDTDLGAIIDKGAARLLPVERLRMLAMLILDTSFRKPAWGKKVLQGLGRAFHRHAKVVKELSSSEVLDLLRPLETTMAPAIRGRHTAGICIERCGALLKKLNDTDLFPALEFLLEEQMFNPALKEVQKRIKKKSSALLAFYEAVLSRLVDDEIYGADDFDMILSDSDEKEIELLRSVARKLSVHASGDLRHALATFDFDYLDDDPDDYEFWGAPDEYDPLDDDSEVCNCPSCRARRAAEGEEVDLMPDFGDIPPESLLDDTIDHILSTAEEFIDEMGLRGASNAAILAARSSGMKGSGQEEDALSAMLLSLAGKEKIKSLSREARVLITGKRSAF